MSYLFAGVELGQVRDAQAAAKVTTTASSVTMDKATLEFQKALAALGAYKGPLDGITANMADIRNALRGRFGMPKLTSRNQPVDKVDNEAVARLIELANKAQQAPITNVITNRPTLLPTAVQQTVKPQAPPPAAVATPVVKPLTTDTASAPTVSAALPQTSKLPGWVLPVAGAAAVWFLFLRK